MRHPTRPTCLTRTTRPLTVLLVLLAAAACADEPTRAPDAAPAAEASVAPLRATDEERGGLRAALQFTGAQAMHGLRERAAADRVNASLERLGARLAANDRAGVVRAVASARIALRHYRELANDEASAAELGAIEIAIDRAESFTRDSVVAAPAAAAPAPPAR